MARLLGERLFRRTQVTSDGAAEASGIVTPDNIQVYTGGHPRKSILKTTYVASEKYMSYNKDGDDYRSTGKDDCTTGRPKQNSNSVTFQNFDTNSPTVKEKACDVAQSQVHDCGMDSEISGNKDGNAWDTPLIKSVSDRKTIKIMELHNEENVKGVVVAIPFGAVEEVRNKFANTLYGYFIGKHPAFMLVEKYVKNTWAKFGLERVMLRNGFLSFQFATRGGIKKVLENGPWIIRCVPLILNIWDHNTSLKKDDITLAPVWVKLHNVPIVAYSETGLSLITTQLGRPIMLDSYTCNMCLNPWGRNTYARALIEVSAAKTLLDSLVVAIPLPNGKGHTLENIEIEVDVTKPVVTNKPSTKPSTSVDDEDGFIEVKNRKKKGKIDNSSRLKVYSADENQKQLLLQLKVQVRVSKNESNVASTSGNTKTGVTTPVSNSFDVLNAVEDGDPSGHNLKASEHVDSGKVDGNVHTGVKEATEAHDETIGLSPRHGYAVSSLMDTVYWSSEQ
ncbi:zinc knuckle CX2CX4HX4C containing protein [Tanacetum coccineum]